MAEQRDTQSVPQPEHLTTELWTTETPEGKGTRITTPLIHTWKSGGLLFLREAPGKPGGGSGGQRCLAGRGPGDPPPTGTSTTIPWLPVLPQLSPSSSHSKSARNCQLCVLRAPGPPGLRHRLVTLRLRRPHSKFAAVLTHWLGGRWSRETTPQPPTQAEFRPAGRPHVTHSLRESTSGHS